MKTLHLHRQPTTIDRPSTTLRLGVVVSFLAAVLAIGLKSIADVPAAIILAPVVIVGFALSWHASGRPLDDDTHSH